MLVIFVLPDLVVCVSILTVRPSQLMQTLYASEMLALVRNLVPSVNTNEKAGLPIGELFKRLML